MTSWVVKFTVVGGQRDGDIETYEVLDSLARLDEVAGRKGHVKEIHILRAPGVNGAELMYRSLTAPRRHVDPLR